MVSSYKLLTVHRLIDVIDTARIVCDRVCVTIRCPSVGFARLSVCVSHFAPEQRRAARLLLWARRAGNIDRQWRVPSSSGATARAAARRSAANASSVTFIADVGGCRQTRWLLFSAASRPAEAAHRAVLLVLVWDYGLLSAASYNT